jgi:proline iminopeptidase
VNKWLKRLIAALSVIVVLVAAAGGYLWYAMNQPLYQPGMVRAGNGLRGPLEPPPQSGKVQSWQVETDIQLHYFSAGQGRPVLVIHGGPGLPYAQPWSGLAALTNRYTFYYYDQRGCGGSTRPFDRFSSSNYYQNMTRLDQTLGLGAQIADIERIRRILGQDRLILIGHSFGGFLASLYAAEFPEYVQALVLVAPADLLVMPPADGGLFELVRARLPAGRRVAYDAYLKQYLDFQNIFQQSEADLAALNETFGQYYAEVSPMPAALQAKSGGWMVQAMYFSMGQRHDYRQALTAVKAPVLVIHGALDLQPEAASRLYAGAFPNARFQVIAGATHFPFEEGPQAFGDAVGGFLNALP